MPRLTPAKPRSLDTGDVLFAIPDDAYRTISGEGGEPLAVIVLTSEAALELSADLARAAIESTHKLEARLQEFADLCERQQHLLESV